MTNAMEFAKKRSIAGMRDKVIHAYFGVKIERVWEVLTYSLHFSGESMSENKHGKVIYDEIKVVEKSVWGEKSEGMYSKLPLKEEALKLSGV